MIQGLGCNFRSVDIPGLARRDFVEFAGSGHHGDVYGKIRAGKLGLEDLLQTVRTKILRLKAIKLKTILRFEKGTKEGNALDVIPVVMGNENVGLDAVAVLARRKTIAQHADACAA